MLRVINKVEKNVRALPAIVTELVDNTATDILVDVSNSEKEFSGRYIQNVGAGILHYAFGQDCDGTLGYHGILSVYQQLDCSNHPCRVSVFSTITGGKVAVTILRRDDFCQQN